jgi:hypothetical protein
MICFARPGMVDDLMYFKGESFQYCAMFMNLHLAKAKHEGCYRRIMITRVQFLKKEN